MGSGPGGATKESRWQAEFAVKGFDPGSEQDEVRSRDGESPCVDVLGGAATYTDATGMWVGGCGNARYKSDSSVVVPVGQEEGSVATERWIEALEKFFDRNKEDLV